RAASSSASIPHAKRRRTTASVPRAIFSVSGERVSNRSCIAGVVPIRSVICTVGKVAHGADDIVRQPGATLPWPPCPPRRSEQAREEGKVVRRGQRRRRRCIGWAARRCAFVHPAELPYNRNALGTML